MLRFLLGAGLLVALLAALLGRPVHAQSVVVPNSALNVEGNTLDREPFGFEALRHVTYIHRDQLWGIGAQAAINRIAYRRDATIPLQVMRRPQGIWQIRVGNYEGSVAQPPSAWPDNQDPNWTLVLSARTVSFPELWQGSSPAPFQLPFHFDVPFVYVGGHIGIEHFVYDRQMQHDYFVDAVDGLVPGGTVTTLPGSQGCPAGQNRVTGQAPNPGGGNLELYLFGGPAQTPALLALGGSHQWWNGRSLPLDLGGLGLPGCRIQVANDVLVPARTTVGGVAALHLPIPGNPMLLGASVYAQWFCIGDTRVSQALPLTVSDAVHCTLGTRLNSGFIGMSVVSAFSGSNQFGYVQPNRGPVIELSR